MQFNLLIMDCHSPEQALMLSSMKEL